VVRFLSHNGTNTVAGISASALACFALGPVAWSADYRGVAIALFISGGFLLTVVAAGVALLIFHKSDDEQNERSGAVARADRASTAQSAGRDAYHIGEYHAAPATISRRREWFEKNDDPSKGALSNGIWWDLLGWRFYYTSDLPSLTIVPKCGFHRLALLIMDWQGNWVAINQESVKDNDQLCWFLCPEPAAEHRIDLKMGWDSLKAAADAVVDREARHGGWRYGATKSTPGPLPEGEKASLYRRES